MSRSNKKQSKGTTASTGGDSAQVENELHGNDERHRGDLFDEDLDDASEASFYSMRKPFALKYHEAAQILASIHRYQEFFDGVWSNYDEADDHGEISRLEKVYELQVRCSADPLILDVTDLLGVGNYKAILRIAQTFADYEEGFPRLRGEEAKAKLFVMIVCEDLHENGYERRNLSKALIRRQADHMRAVRSLRSQKRLRNSSKKRRLFEVKADLIEKETAALRLQKSAWTRIFKDLGLEDIEPGDPGPITRKE
jgi:hypothetical protein